MTTKDELHEIVHYLKQEDRERGLPCFVGHGKDVEPCKRPSTMRVCGIHMCRVPRTARRPRAAPSRR